MRIRSLDPSYLDTKGLVALWRETLLARKVLLGETVGYRNHPQLHRFKAKNQHALVYIDAYLTYVFLEAQKRGYHFDKRKFEDVVVGEKLLVTRGQLMYERDHLLKKLKLRDQKKYTALKKIALDKIQSHPLFDVREGGIEEWEVV